MSEGTETFSEANMLSDPKIQSASHTFVHQGGVKSTPSSPRLRVGVILTDPEPVNEALRFSFSDS